MAILSIILILLSLFYFKEVETEKGSFKFSDVLLVLASSMGAGITYWLNIQFDMGTVLAAGITGFTASLLPYLNRESNLLRSLPAPVYCGAFAGMTTPLVANGYFFILSAGLISGIILVMAKSSLHGFGGKLGTIAFGGVALVSFLIYMI